MATGRIIRPRTQEGWDLLVPGRKPQGRVELSSKSELAAYLTNAIFPDIGLNVITNSLALRDTTGRRIIKGNNNAYAVSSAIQYYKNTQVNDVADELTVFAIVTHSVSNVFQLFVSRSESTKKTYQIGIESDGRVKATSWSSDAFKDLKVTTAWASVASAPFERHVIALRSDGSTLTLYSSVNGGETATAAFGALDNDGAGISILSRSSNDTGTTTTIPVLGGGVELVLEFNKALSDEELDRLIADPYQLFEPANDTPFLISIPGGGGAETINADFISSVTSVYEPTLTTGAVTISVDFVSAATSVYEPTVSAPSGTQDVTADFISSATSVYEPTVTTGAVTVTADFIAASTSVHESTLTVGAVTITADFVSAATSVYEPTVFSGSAIIPDFIAAATSVYEPTVTTGAVTIAADLIAAGTIVYEPSVSSAVNISADFIAAATSVHEAIVGVGAVTILADFISSGTIVYEPSIPFGQIISADFIAALSAVYEPSVTDAAAIWTEITPVSTIWTEI